MSLIEVARDEIFSQLARADRRVHIASPFLSADIATALVQQARVGRASQLRMLTALTERSVIGGALDPHALAALIRGRWAVASIPNLHAKAALVDGSWGLVGSGNLTTAGLGARAATRGNVELGVLLTRAQVREAEAIFDRWWGVAEPVTEGNLAPFLEMEPERFSPRSNRRVGNAIPVRVGRTLERLERRTASSRNSWIKAMYHDPRKDRPGWWRKRTWINDRHVQVAGRPTRRPGYAVGDLVALYLVEPGVLAALYEVTGAPEFDPTTVAAERAVDSERYGWVTPVEVVAAVELDEAPHLAEFGIDGRSLQNGRKFMEDRQLWRRIERRLTAS